MASHLCSSDFHHCDKFLGKQLQKGRDSFVLRVYSFQNKVVWICCFGPKVSENTMVQEPVAEAAYLMVQKTQS